MSLRPTAPANSTRWTRSSSCRSWRSNHATTQWPKVRWVPRALCRCCPSTTWTSYWTTAAKRRFSSRTSTSRSARRSCANTSAASATPRPRCRCTPAPSTSQAAPTPPRCSPRARASSRSGRRRASRKAFDAAGRLLELPEGPGVGKAHVVRGAIGAEVDARRGRHRFTLQQLNAVLARVAPAIGVNVEGAVRLNRHGEIGVLQRWQQEIAPTRELVAATLEDRERLGAERGACRVLRRRRRRDEKMLRQLLEAAHRMRRQHDPAEPPAGHAEVLRKAVDHHDLARQTERCPRLRAVGESLVDLVDD